MKHEGDKSLIMKHFRFSCSLSVLFVDNASMQSVNEHPWCRERNWINVRCLVDWYQRRHQFRNQLRLLSSVLQDVYIWITHQLFGLCLTSCMVYELTSHADREIIFRCYFPSAVSCQTSERFFFFPLSFFHPAAGAHAVCQAAPLYTNTHFLLCGCLHGAFAHNNSWHNSILQQSFPVCHLVQREIVNVKCVLLADTFTTTPDLNSCRAYATSFIHSHTTLPCL